MQKPNSSRLLLAQLRGGDYAHAGDEEAIAMVVEKVLTFDPALKNKSVLDVGSGFGGTAQYLYKSGFHYVQGIDLDQAAVKYAKEKYPSIQFTTANASIVDQLYPSHHFSFIYLFNVIYAIEDKKSLLTKLSKIAMPGAILAVFDYTQGKDNNQLLQKDLAGKPMYPINLIQFQNELKETGWEILEVTDMTQKYKGWYQELLSKLHSEDAAIKREFSQQDITKIHGTFSVFLDRIEQGILGGAIIYARKSEQ